MAEISSGFFYDIGGREIYEDRARIEALTTAGGLNLHIAAIADGVGGENKGERAAQLGLDALFDYFSRSGETDVPTLLQQAAAYANSKVHAEQERTQGASATLSVAVIVDKERLYIANIGDSRIYLVRNDKLTQLSMDHTFATIMVWQGKLSKEAALANPRAEAIMRALGPKKNVPIDIGFYVNTEDPRVAKTRGQKGLPLKEGDSILVCSDGLIKDSPDGAPYTTDDEIIRTLSTQEAQKAAQMLVSFAIGRDADDNVSVATLQLPDPQRAMTLAQLQAAEQATRQRKQLLLGGGALAIILALIGIIFGLNSQNRDAQSETAAIVAQGTEAAQAFKATSVQRETADAEATSRAQLEGTSLASAEIAFTPTPSLTPQPSLTPSSEPEIDSIGFFYLGDDDSSRINIQAGSVISNTEEGQLLGLELDAEQGEDQTQYASLYIHPGSELEFNFVSKKRMGMIVQPGSDLYGDAGKYTGGIEIELAPDNDVLMTFNSCFSVQYPEQGNVVANCYEGSCTVRTPNETVIISAGEQISLDIKSFEIAQASTIPATQGESDRAFITQTDSGIEDAERCLDVEDTQLAPTSLPEDSQDQGVVDKSTKVPPTPTSQTAGSQSQTTTNVSTPNWSATSTSEAASSQSTATANAPTPNWSATHAVATSNSTTATSEATSSQSQATANAPTPNWSATNAAATSTSTAATSEAASSQSQTTANDTSTPDWAATSAAATESGGSSVPNTSPPPKEPPFTPAPTPAPSDN
ncbi:MAG: protein phosphatase 2C domain-containing protein [Candidatus Promineifilaceae bacterium]